MCTQFCRIYKAALSVCLALKLLRMPEHTFKLTLLACLMLAVPPKVLHYGLHWDVGKTGYEFDKHWFYDFDALQCPPWNLTANSKGGLFKHPPHPATYPTKVSNVPTFLFFILGVCVWTMG